MVNLKPLKPRPFCGFNCIDSAGCWLRYKLFEVVLSKVQLLDYLEIYRLGYLQVILGNASLY